MAENESVSELLPCARTATNVALVIHGGAGAILRQQMPPEMEATFKTSLAAALHGGYAVLQNGGSAVDAVEASVRLLEDNPLFNAGRGAVFTADGRNELDAAIMDGKTGEAGAVAGVTRPRNPVTLARAVMERTPFVLLSREGADKLALDLGLPTVDPPYFWTEMRWKQLIDRQQREAENDPDAKRDRDNYFVSLSEDGKYGTVGAAAVDREGNIAAATSTGGMTNKRYGRIGDSPLIGAGTWADNNTCAVSATGHGEYFIRLGVAHDIAARIRYAKATLAEAAEQVVLGELKRIGGDGGVIAIDRDGNAALPFNTPGMYRGYITQDGVVHVSIFAD